MSVRLLVHGDKTWIFRLLCFRYPGTWILWTSTENTEKIVKRVVKDVQEGDIILMHDIFQSSVDAAFCRWQIYWKSRDMNLLQ